ncbi:DUF6787 family protein [Persicitalea jodogahamensis]|uniref:DUF6787 domain-containing protein n=1 Tax=Persicitalea jodogahamensis TaxID=402147 RepID=A0A8J3D7S7_9BACT|nr:DUF6787 family protein [Persicitalea jodogahamensis]GHB85208.1 hypothetical protein GCM10007390_45660 [Persicitalea jodogahamensis]
MAESRLPKASFWQKLKDRWNVQSGWDVAVILLVFACTGFSILYLKKILYGWMGVTAASPGWLRWLLAIVVVLPLYQVVLLMWGWLLGNFDFFWAFEKRMIARLSGLFGKKQKQ